MDTYEKKYKDALSRARSMYESQDDAELAAYIFPELAESEDEKILRCLKEIVNWGCAKNISVECGVELKDVKSWLEKYKEPKPIYEDEYQKMLADSYNCGKDEVISNPENYGLQKPVEPSGKLSRQDYLYQLLIDQLITYSDYEYLTGKKPAEWSEEDEENLGKLHRLLVICQGEKKFIPSDEYDKLDNWLKSLRPQPHWKPSEDEERLINTSISFLKDFADKGYENAVECIDWLKSKLNGNSCK